nr:proline-rich protein 36-like [Drosophila takahashii]
MLRGYAQQYGVPSDYASYIQQIENAPQNPAAVSGAGAVGLMQLMPGTAAGYGVTPAQLTDPAINMQTGTHLLGDLWHRYGGNPDLVAIAYNAGPGWANRYQNGQIGLNGLPDQTQGYLAKLHAMMGGAPLPQTQPQPQFQHYAAGTGINGLIGAGMPAGFGQQPAMGNVAPPLGSPYSAPRTPVMDMGGRMSGSMVPIPVMSGLVAPGGAAPSAPLPGVFMTDTPQSPPGMDMAELGRLSQAIQQMTGGAAQQPQQQIPPALRQQMEQDQVTAALRARGITDPAIFGQGEGYGAADLARYPQFNPANPQSYASIPTGSIYQETTAGQNGAGELGTGVFRRKMSAAVQNHTANPQVNTAPGMFGAARDEVSAAGNQIAGMTDNAIATGLRAIGATGRAREYAQAGSNRENAAQVQGKIGAAAGGIIPILGALAAAPETLGASGALALGAGLSGAQGLTESTGHATAAGSGPGQTALDALVGGAGGAAVGAITPTAGRSIIEGLASLVGKDAAAKAAPGLLRSIAEGAGTFGVGNTAVQGAQHLIDPTAFGAPTSGDILGNMAFGGALGALHHVSQPAVPDPLQLTHDPNFNQPPPEGGESQTPPVSPETPGNPTQNGESIPPEDFPPAAPAAPPAESGAPGELPAETPPGEQAAPPEGAPAETSGGEQEPAAEPPAAEPSPRAQPVEAGEVPPVTQFTPQAVQMGLARLAQDHAQAIQALHDVLSNRNVDSEGRYKMPERQSAVTPYMVSSDLNGLTAKELGERVAATQAYHTALAREAATAGITDIPPLSPADPDTASALRDHVPLTSTEYGDDGTARVMLHERPPAQPDEQTPDAQILNSLREQSGIPLGEPKAIPSETLGRMAPEIRDTLARQDRVMRAYETPQARMSAEYLRRQSQLMDSLPDEDLRKIQAEGDKPKAAAHSIILGERARTILEGRRLGSRKGRKRPGLKTACNPGVSDGRR